MTPVERRHSEEERQLQQMASRLVSLAERNAAGSMPDRRRDLWEKYGRWLAGATLLGGWVLWYLSGSGWSVTGAAKMAAAQSARLTTVELTIDSIRTDVRGLKSDARFQNTMACRGVVDRDLIDQCARLGLLTSPRRRD